jgi:hypothetical protein
MMSSRVRDDVHRHVVLFLDYLDYVVEREVAGERDSTTRYKLIESHS